MTRHRGCLSTENPFWDEHVVSGETLSVKLKHAAPTISVPLFVFQVEVKPKKEVSLLDLDDCEFIAFCSTSTIFQRNFIAPVLLEKSP